MEIAIEESLFFDGDSELWVQFMEEYVPEAVRHDRDFLLWFLTNIRPEGGHHPDGVIGLDHYVEWVGEELRADKEFMLKVTYPARSSLASPRLQPPYLNLKTASPHS